MLKLSDLLIHEGISSILLLSSALMFQLLPLIYLSSKGALCRKRTCYILRVLSQDHLGLSWVGFVPALSLTCNMSIPGSHGEESLASSF